MVLETPTPSFKSRYLSRNEEGGGGGVKISARVSAYLGFKPNNFKIHTSWKGGGQNRSSCLAI